MAAVGPADEVFWAAFPPGASRELVRAGIDTFARQGFAATTTRDIARTAGLSPAGLYVHHQSKAALLHVISRAGHASAAAVLSAGLQAPLEAGDRPRVDRIADTVATFAAWHAQHHRVARVVQYELGSLEPDAYAEVATMRRDMQDGLADAIADAVEAAEAEVVDVPGVARAAMSLCIDVCRWYDPDGRQDPDEVGALYRDLVRRWLVPPADAEPTDARSAT